MISNLAIMVRRVLFILVLFQFWGCYKDAKHDRPSLDDISLADPNLTIELVASEPVINAPIAMDIDHQGRLWILEMPDYMPDIDGKDEEIAQGRIVILNDHDKDGIAEDATVFLDSLHHPRAICLAYGGILYAAPPNLWFTSIIDDQPGQTTLIDSTYALGGNIEHQPNGLLMNIDNWIYSAKSKARYQRINGVWHKEPTAFRGQWGISHDEYGRLYYNDNSNGLYGDELLPNTITQHPYLHDPKGITTNLLLERDIYPAHSTVVNRGYLDYMLDSNEVVVSMTSTCGPLIYNGGQLGLEYQSNGFISVPEGNLVKRVTLKNNLEEQRALNVYENSEWLTSTDEGFRPVNLHHATDGALYIVDFHRGIIQHSTYMTDYLRSLILERDLNKIKGMGRIIKISGPSNHSKNIDNYKLLDNSDLINLLHSDNILIRKKAQQELIERGNKDLLPSLYARLKIADEIEKIHILYVIKGLGAIEISRLKNTSALSMPWYNNHLLTTLSTIEGVDTSEEEEFFNLIAQINEYKTSNNYVAFALGKIRSQNLVLRKRAIYQQLMLDQPKSKMLVQMMIAGAPLDDPITSSLLLKSGIKSYIRELEKIRKNIDARNLSQIHMPSNNAKDDKTRGRTLYLELCASCHNSDGRGMHNLAPSLKGARIIEGKPEGIALTILAGMHGPVTINDAIEEYNTAMPGLSENKHLSDENIVDLVNFITNAFRSRPSKLISRKIPVLRIIADTLNRPSDEEAIIKAVGQLE